MGSLRRLPILFVEYPVFFVTTCTHHRRKILARDDVHNAFLTFALHAADYGVWVGRYVLMPDHIHLFAAFGPESIALSKWQKALKRTISKVLNTATFESPHWEKGFFDHLIRSEESYEEKWLYVKNNPVRAGLVQKPEDWPYAGEICEIVHIETKNAR